MSDNTTDYASDRAFVEQLAQFENAAPVNDLERNGIKLWPLLRWMIVDRSRSHLKGAETGDRKFLGLGTFLSFPLRKAVTFLRHPTSLGFLLRDLLQPPRTPIDLLSISLVSGKQQTVNQRQFSKFSDALGELLQLDYRVVDWDLFFHTPQAYGHRARRPRFADAAVGGSALRLKFDQLFRRATPPSPGFLSVFEKLEQAAHSFDALAMPDAQAVWLRADFIQRLSPPIEKRLRAWKVRGIFLGGYYHDIGFATCFAARRMGIPVMEVQHGQQGPYHPMYTHWSNIPASGYEWLPSHFWTWGEPSRTVIDESMGACPAHQVITGGNPWLAYRTATTALAPSVWSIATDDRIPVLIALQPIEDPLPAHLVEAMAKGADVHWIVRPHPAMRKALPEMRAQLEHAGIAHFELESIMDSDLYELLTRVEVNITCWSSVAYEALCFNVPSVIIHPNGRDIMQAYIEAGFFGYAATDDDLLHLIRTRSFQPVPEDAAYILASPDHIRATVAAVLEQGVPLA